MATRPLELSHDDDNVIYGGSQGNVTVYAVDVFQPIIKWQVPRQVAWSMIKNPKVRMKLYDTGGSELSSATELMISIRKPGQRLYQEISTVKLYATYRNLTLAQQQDKDNDASVRFNLKQAGSFPEEAELVILAKVPSQVTIDWSSSEIYIGEASKNDLVETDV